MSVLKILPPKCDLCKDDIVLGEMWVKIKLEDQVYIVHKNRRLPETKGNNTCVNVFKERFGENNS